MAVEATVFEKFMLHVIRLKRSIKHALALRHGQKMMGLSDLFQDV